MRDATYQLVVRGELDTRFELVFTGMELSQVEGTTVMTGKVRDDAELYGLVERIAELGLELVSIQQLVRPANGEGRSA
ncbi:MAG TPA: hypothetical protein VII16_00295 [Actinomycetes bacterium]